MRFLVTAGPTREAIDPVRFLSNRSTGKMGFALAAAAAAMGHEVTLIAGPVALSTPERTRRIDVVSAADMAATVKAEFPLADVTIMTAAVADYRPKQVAPNKIKKREGDWSLELERTEDILSAIGKLKSQRQILVGFAAETEDLLENAVRKMKAKNLDWIVANDVGAADRGFASDSNAVTLLSRSGERLDLPLMPKTKLASRLIELLLSTE